MPAHSLRLFWTLVVELGSCVRNQPDSTVPITRRLRGMRIPPPASSARLEALLVALLVLIYATDFSYYSPFTN